MQSWGAGVKITINFDLCSTPIDGVKGDKFVVHYGGVEILIPTLLAFKVLETVMFSRFHQLIEIPPPVSVKKVKKFWDIKTRLGLRSSAGGNISMWLLDLSLIFTKFTLAWVVSWCLVLTFVVAFSRVLIISVEDMKRCISFGWFQV